MTASTDSHSHDAVSEAGSSSPTRLSQPYARTAWLASDFMRIVTAFFIGALGLRLFDIKRSYDIFVDEVTYEQLLRT